MQQFLDTCIKITHKSAMAHFSADLSNDIQPDLCDNKENIYF
ncbi:hypothetical protein MITSMUL_04640 [Mitsuokella multacida DSM 20544]|uniref:Uncharacterized protein n=1 Tax=Mitsuokella multacida DSM 20544 TaxID=500635 RepID=C9KNF2_9FIRM|nr:hypothetical protein MITSMUL_04640 [Mitsuokella multacida DSM 20544]